MERVLSFILGLVYIGGGAFFVRSSIAARNFLIAVFIGIFGIAIGLFLCYAAFLPPN